MNATIDEAVGRGPARLPDELARRLEVVEREALALAHSVWWAGGGVRDLLLGRLAADLDLDLVLESDPLALATSLWQALGGRLVEHRAFLTVTLEGSAGGRIDLARARTERYRRPGALPVVEPASLEQDLRRRDFTINALALPARVPPFGLVDPCGGRSDLESGRLRILHERSFLDDPTRILRGVRFESRLGFRFDAETEARARSAVRSGALSTLSDDRLRRELDLSFESWSDCRATLQRLDDLGAIDALTGTRLAPRTLEWIGAAAEATAALDWLGGGSAPPTPWELVWLALRLGADPLRSRGRLERLVPPGVEGAATGLRERLEEVVARVGAPGLRRSEAARLLDPLAPSELAWVAAASRRARDRVGAYLSRDRGFRLAISGRDLIESGIGEGPGIGRALDATRRARLDGEIGADEELAFALGRAREEA